MAVVESAAAGLEASGRATIVQLRALRLTTREIEREAEELVAASPIPVVISSRCDVALACGAAGVNLPERDIGIEFARGLIRRGLVGKSVHSIEGARRAQLEGADYVIFGPVWRSASHPEVQPAGVEALSAVTAAVRIPVLAIGGVTEERVTEVRSAGAAGHAGIGMFR